jgi:hypothetical protein
MLLAADGNKNHPPCHEGRRVVTLKQPVAKHWLVNSLSYNTGVPL